MTLIALVAITKHGVEQACKLAELLPEAEVVVFEKRGDWLNDARLDRKGDSRNRPPT